MKGTEDSGRKLALQFDRCQSLEVMVDSFQKHGVLVSTVAEDNNGTRLDQFLDRSRGGFPNVNDPAGT